MGWQLFKRAAPDARPPAPASSKRGRRFGGFSLSGLLKAGAPSNDRWPSHPVAPDTMIAQQHTALVARSRDQWANNDYVRAFIRLIRQNVIGPTGIIMQAKVRNTRGRPDKALNAALEDGFAEWGRKGNCDVTGGLSWREVQCLAVETAARDGEFFVRLVYGPEAGPLGFAVQFI